jgi:peroxiredoxin
LDSATEKSKSEKSGRVSGEEIVGLRQPGLKPGDRAPDFSLQDQNGREVTLAGYLGKRNVALAFYIKAFTGG